MKRLLTIIALVACMAQQADANNLYQRYIYYNCGKPYYGYRAYAAPAQAKPYNYASHATTYNYTINYAQPAALQGKTVYGLTDIAEFYGSVDLGAQLYQAQRLAEGSQKLSQSATSGYLDMLGQTSADRTRIAEILAKGNAAAQALTAANAQASATIVRQVSGHHVEESTETTSDLSGIASKCASCHSEGAASAKGGEVVLPAFDALNREQVDLVFNYVTTLDDRNCARKAQLSTAEHAALRDYLCERKAGK